MPFVLSYCKEIETPKDNVKILTNNEDELIMPEPTYCIVNSNNILWTCHKACNIQFGDCDYSLYSKCYSGKSIDTGNSNTKKGRKKSKWRCLIQSIDDNNTMCCHDINSLVPFMDRTFFTSKYKETIKANRYVLPMNCSECDAVLVDKKPNVAVKAKKNLFAVI